MALGSTVLKSFQTFIYVLCFCCAGTILALYSYFLAVESSNHIHIPKKHRAIEGISGIGVVYTIVAVLLTCCLGGHMFFAFIGIILDIAFVGGFIAIAVMAGDGATSCNGQTVKTPLGEGAPTSHTSYSGEHIAPKLKTVCHMESAVFAVAIIGAFLFLVAAFVQLWLGRKHRKDKAFGPSPGNNYTYGSKPGFFSRRKNRHSKATKDAEMAGAAAGVAGVAHHHEQHNGIMHDNVNNAHTGYGTNGFEQHHANVAGADSGIPTAGGYHAGPGGSAVNPYRAV